MTNSSQIEVCDLKKGVTSNTHLLTEARPLQTARPHFWNELPGTPGVSGIHDPLRLLDGWSVDSDRSVSSGGGEAAWSGEWSKQKRKSREKKCDVITGRTRFDLKNRDETQTSSIWPPTEESLHHQTTPPHTPTETPADSTLDFRGLRLRVRGDSSTASTVRLEQLVEYGLGDLQFLLRERGHCLAPAHASWRGAARCEKIRMKSDELTLKQLFGGGMWGAIHVLVEGHQVLL